MKEKLMRMKREKRQEEEEHWEKRVVK